MKFSIFAFCFALAISGTGAVVIETAQSGGYGAVTGGNPISASYYAGFAFQIDTPTTIDWIGAHFYSVNPDTTMFVAIANLNSLNDLPNGNPFDPGEVAGSVVFDEIPQGAASTMYYESVSMSLSAGYYAVIAGSGAFGATGSGTLATSGANITPDLVMWDVLGWNPGNSPSCRLTLGTSAVPEPASMAVAACCLVGFGLHIISKRSQKRCQNQSPLQNRLRSKL